MGKKYWKVICRYGHVGRRNEVSVARYLETEVHLSCIDVWDIARGMPGVKNNGVSFITQINEGQWAAGRQSEDDNLYLQRLRPPKISMVS